MRQHRIIHTLMLIMFAMMITISCAISQEPGAPQGPVAVETEKISAPAEGELSIYGEVQSVSIEKNSALVQYYDYDTDEEKTVELVLDKDTKLENANSLSDIKQGDWVDATYAVSDGKNIAKIITVEKEEALPEMEPLEEEPAAPIAPGLEPTKE